MIEKPELARKIFQTSHLEGRFRLRSGEISGEYFDKYLFESDPLLLAEIARHLESYLPADAEVLAGLELGGIPLATVISQHTGLPAVFVRKQAKQYGTCNLVEGGAVVGRNLLLVEDVVTSGGQILASAAALRQLGARISAAVCVIDRDAGAVESLAAEGLELRTLFTMSELRSAAGLQS